MLLFGSDAKPPGLARHGLSVVLIPMLTVVALIANVTMAGDWGDDCLAYTVTPGRELQR